MKLRLIVLSATLFVCCGSLARADSRAVFINGEQLSAETLTALQIAYRTTIPGGRYWYDIYSGLWGREGQPAAGQIQAGLDLGGPLDEDASAGDTPVLVNGRRLTRSEVSQVMQLVGPFLPGRYWLDAQGNVGFEGGPALVNLVAASRSRAQASGGWNRNTPGGNWGGDDRCSYYSHPDGPSVMIGDC